MFLKIFYDIYTFAFERCLELMYKEISTDFIKISPFQDNYASLLFHLFSKNHIELRFFYETFVVESVEQVSKIELSSVLGRLSFLYTNRYSTLLRLFCLMVPDR